MDCPLPAPLPARLRPLRPGHLLPPHPLAHAVQPVQAARIAAATAAPLPARGPPPHSDLFLIRSHPVPSCPGAGGALFVCAAGWAPTKGLAGAGLPPSE